MKHVFVVTLGLAIAAGSTACSKPDSAPTTTAPALSVATVQAVETDLAQSFETGGAVRAHAVATMVSRIMAQVRSVPVNPGDRVRAGQPLVFLDARELEANQARADAGRTATQQGAALAEADRQAAEAALVLARVTHQRIADLRAKNSATPHELDEAVAGLRAAEARLKVAEARVSEAAAGIASTTAASTGAQVAASYATVTSPFDGLVTDKLVDPGTMATPGLPLVTVEDTRSFRLEVRLDESRAALVHLGDTVTVRVDRSLSPADAALATQSASIEGRVTEMSRMLDAASHDFLVKILLPDGAGLRSGMFGRALFRGAPYRGLAVPDSAVTRRGQLAFVFVVESGNRAHLRMVNAAASADGRVEIRAGLKAGERVVLNPPPALVDGSPVTSAAPSSGEVR